MTREQRDPGKSMDSKRRQSIIQHPLRDPATLERIFRYLPVEDLKVCRMTLKPWHEPATRLLSLKIHGIVLHEKTEWKKFLKIFTKACTSTSTRLQGLSHIHPFHSFVFYGTYPEDPSWTPYKSAILDYMHAKVKLPKKTVWEEKFFTTFGLQVLELRYYQFNFLNTERALREFREMLSIHCPNLASLTLEFQKETVGGNSGNGKGSGGGGTPTPSPSPSPSPSPQTGGISGGSNNVFFPPNEESLKKSLDSLKSFTICTDNKCWVNPNALEEFMSFMPSLEEFTYRYTGAKKQWAFVRRVDVIDIVCNLIQCGSLSNLKVLDLDSKGTVLSGEDFRKLSAGLVSPSSLSMTGTAKQHHPGSGSRAESISNSITGGSGKGQEHKVHLTRFASQVFIKSELDWEHFCGWLSKFNNSLKEVDIQVRSHLSQLPAEEQLPTEFPNVRKATMLLDNNFQVFLQRMPNVQTFCGVFDNELLPFCSATQNLSLDGGLAFGSSSVGSFGEERNTGSSSSTSSVDGGNNGYPYHHHRRSSSRRGRSLSQRRSRSKSEDNPGGGGSPAATCPPPPPPAAVSAAASAAFTAALLHRTSSKDIPEIPCCENVKYLRIYSYEESMLDIEWKAGVFRQIVSLETDIYYDQDLRLIWTHLNQTLRELIVHLKIIVPEQAFTGGGVSTITFQELSRSQSKSGKGKDASSGTGEIDYHDEEHLAHLDEYPNLGMMKNLRVLEVHTLGRQDMVGTSVFSASIIIFGVSLLPLLQRLVLPPAIPPKCLENSISYLGKLLHLRYLSVCDDTFQSVLPFHVLKCGLPDLEIVVKYYQNDIKRTLCNMWRAERLVFPDFLPEHRSTSASVGSGNGLPSLPSSARSRFQLSKQCSAP